MEKLLRIDFFKFAKAKVHNDGKGKNSCFFSIILVNNSMKNEIIFYVEESAEGGYEAKALGFSIFTEGETLDELKANVRDAVNCHFEEKAPSVIRLH